MTIWFTWLCLLLFLPSLSYSNIPSPPSVFTHLPPPKCHHFESSALLHFKNSLSLFNETSYFTYCADSGFPSRNSTMSWDMSTDCCTWSGVTCDEVTGHVIRLELACSGLEGIIHSNNSLFSLTHLQTLILSHNLFYDSKISPLFGRFVSMIHLDLSDSGFTGLVPLEFSYVSSLVTLDLSENYDLRLESFSLKRILTNLTRLRELSLNDVNMSYVSARSFTNLSTSLTSLDLSFSELKGEFPENIFHLPKLEMLDLSYNTNLSGSIPQYNLTSPLKNLNLSDTGFFIDVSHLTKSFKSLSTLFLSFCSFRGSYPTLLGNLTQITSLDLSYNNFGGQISWSSLNLEQLTYLDLSGNNFIGKLPKACIDSANNTFLCDSSKHRSVGTLPFNLKSLHLYNNSLNGTIPSWLYSLPSLQYLDLSSNQFTGHISEFQYNSLLYLDLQSNKLDGFIPGSIFHQVNLSRLYLSSNNLSDVVLSDQFSKLKNLHSIDLSFNNLSMNSINFVISSLPDTLHSLSLSSCRLREFPRSLRIFENLEWLDLSSNQIEGSVPQWFWNVGKDSLRSLNISHNLLTHMETIPWKTLEYIDLSSNQLQGHLPIPPPSTSLFSVSNNQFIGEISSLFCNLSEIQLLDLSNNSLSGSIPSCFGNLSSILEVLNLRMNKFYGMLPTTFAKGNKLRNLNLNGNQLEGPLSQSLLNGTELEILDVGNNKLNGSFPRWLESLPNLQVLILRSNKFHGSLGSPKVRFPFRKLRIVDISNNEFTGILPMKYFENLVAMMDVQTNALEYMRSDIILGALYYSVMVTMKGLYIDLVGIQTMFIFIDFSSNNFIGEIPMVIGKLNSLKGLNLSHNNLSGFIPPLFGNLSNLEWLDLSSNELSGNIPWQLAADLNQLENLNLSNNKLEGPIPRGKQFDTFSNDSYSGNARLCGTPLSKSCNSDEAQPDQGKDDGEHDNGIIDWKVVMMGYGSGLVIGISIGYMVLFGRSFDYWFQKRFGGKICKTNARLRGRRRSN